ncbi:restriction endonuclease [Streptomyces sp. HNM0575]|uniref:BsuBI/PstI family type II restriction endonuclease n=1 Tax=Streptomyces sp. HNM0575 TaxID=2716338 RepID=UPI00145F892C|nr:BsuBI/PstI family type II restriction endonuclease [Streptomyces sp. HNM0575]NLU74432.1 restriction endonuclease [Streptomyces sp. HNM0575]
MPPASEAQHQKVREAREILKELGLPKPQQSTRTALVLLAMLGLEPDSPWPAVRSNPLGITESMDWMADHYPFIKKGRQDPTRYKPNSRESIRRQSVKQLVVAGVLTANSDMPDRTTNDQNNRYEPTPIALAAIATFGTENWQTELQRFHAECGILRERWEAERRARQVPVVLPGDGKEIALSPGKHSEVIRAVVESFAPHFTPGATVVYIGDTGTKWLVNKVDYLEGLGVTVNTHGKMPDVVLHDQERDWLVLVEAVTSHGPVNSVRVDELKELFKDARPGLVFVTAFPDKPTFRRFAPDIAWETEVWIAENRTHMVHYNGERFLGPYS